MNTDAVIFMQPKLNVRALGASPVRTGVDESNMIYCPPDGACESRLSRKSKEFMMQKKFSVVLGALMLLLMAPVFAADEDPNLYLINARQGEMYVRAYSAGGLFAMAKGKVPYDAAAAAKLANNLKVMLDLDMGGAWAPGTGKDKYPEKTHALPEIWSTYPKIAESGKAYATAVNELAAVAGNGLEQLQSKIGDLGQSCKGCHDDFREKE